MTKRLNDSGFLLETTEIDREVDLPGGITAWIGQLRTYRRGSFVYKIRDLWCDSTKEHLLTCQYATRPNDISSAHVWIDCREGVDFMDIQPLYGINDAKATKAF